MREVNGGPRGSYYSDMPPLGDGRGSRVELRFLGAGPSSTTLKCRDPAEVRRFEATVRTELGTVTIAHRWIGHPNICDLQGGYGVQTLNNRHLNRADFLLQGPPPDALFLSSGVHDMHLGLWDPKAKTKALGKNATPPAVYERHVNAAFDRFGAYDIDPSAMFWVSNNALDRCNKDGAYSEYDEAAKRVATQRGGHYVDLTQDKERHFAGGFLSACCGDHLSMHHGIIAHQQGAAQGNNKSLVASALEVQRLLGALCPSLRDRPTGTDPVHRPGSERDARKSRGRRTSVLGSR